MNLEKTFAIQQLFRSFELLKKNPVMLLLCLVVDVAFLFFYGLFTTPFNDKISEHIIFIGNLMSQSLREQKQGIINLLFAEAIMPYTYKLFLLLLLLVVSVFVAYSIFQGINWRLANSLAGKDTYFYKYILSFAKVNLLWFGFLLVYYILDFAADVRHIVAEKIAQANVINIFAYLLFVFLTALIYFACISYATLSIKKSFQIGIKKARHTLPVFLLIAVYFLALNFILFNLAKVSRDAMFILGVILFFPALTLARVYIASAVKKI